MRQQHRDENSEEINFFKEEISYLKSIANQSDGLNPKEQSEDVRELYREYLRGTTTSHNHIRITWVSPSQEYVVLKRRGHGSGGWDGWYLNVEYRLYHVSTEIEKLEKGHNDDISYGFGGLFWREGKKWSKARLKEVKEAIEKHKLEQYD